MRCDKMSLALIWVCILTSIFLESTGLTGHCSDWLLKFGNKAVMRPLVHASRAVSAMPDAVDTTVDYAASFLGINHLGISTFTALVAVCIAAWSIKQCSPWLRTEVPEVIRQCRSASGRWLRRHQQLQNFFDLVTFSLAVLLGIALVTLFVTESLLAGWHGHTLTREYHFQRPTALIWHTASYVPPSKPIYNQMPTIASPQLDAETLQAFQLMYSNRPPIDTTAVQPLAGQQSTAHKAPTTHHVQPVSTQLENWQQTVTPSACTSVASAAILGASPHPATMLPQTVSFTCSSLPFWSASKPADFNNFTPWGMATSGIITTAAGPSHLPVPGDQSPSPGDQSPSPALQPTTSPAASDAHTAAESTALVPYHSLVSSYKFAELYLPTCDVSSNPQVSVLEKHPALVLHIKPVCPTTQQLLLAAALQPTQPEVCSTLHDDSTCSTSKMPAVLPASDSFDATELEVLHKIKAADLSSHVLVSLALAPSLESCVPWDLFGQDGAKLGGNASLINLPAERISAAAAKPSGKGFMSTFLQATIRSGASSLLTAMDTLSTFNIDMPSIVTLFARLIAELLYGVLLSGAAILLWLYLKLVATAKPAVKPSRGLKDKQDQPDYPMYGLGPVSRHGSLITTRVAVADNAAMHNNTSSPQLRPLLDAESIVPREATAMANEARNIASTVQIASPSPSSNSMLLETAVEGNEAGLESDTKISQDQAAKVGAITEHAGVQQQQQSSPDVVIMSTEAAVQHVHSSGDILEAAVGQQSADVQGCGSRHMSEDSMERPESTLVEVDQLSSNSVDLRAAFEASDASLVTPVEVVQLSEHNHQNRLAPILSAGLNNTDSTIPDNSLSTSSEGLPAAMPETPADLPSDLLGPETKLGVVKGTAEEAFGDETPRQCRGIKGRLDGTFRVAVGFVRKHPETVAVVGVAVTVIGLLARGRRCRR